ncbi:MULTISPECIES: glycosyltransferase family 2 protein [unclassified Streptomyces]|uniref:glycosyltransferase family 2 protein n=1 Tax=unclassified Streptomyces TaxID=2593676 RepID=UPI001BEC2C69|nr:MULTISPECIES: glycosyltransferase family 2 protein [unclassified Streptomyces]MBT2404121.1 glycosyltransferase family 2 protein [Streptomyces sp. ISL-21]MBT2612703.1 glycosyltransferase family 2 protein [Streptomyces sp. ISL-87]
MSLHSQSTASYQAAATPEFPRHVVTAVIVAHDGARWLPHTLAGLLGQERPAQSHVAADTGSADDSARLLTEALGPDRVLHLARRTGFGAAVDEATRTAGTLTPEDLPYLKRPSGWDPVSRTWRDDAYDLPELPHGEPVQWLWLLHDDCAPEPDALTELLRVADENPDAAVIGPKLRGWYDKKQLLEAGVTIARSGRRWTGLDRREQDQGQHDQIRPVLSVSTAGMLVRRDVYDALGGFDRRLPLMRDDVDLCWRAQSAGHVVLVAPDAVMRHAEASARERRTVDCAGRGTASPHRVDKAGAVYTMLANSPGRALPYVLLRVLVGTVLRALGYLIGKAPGQAVDEITGLLATLLRPGRILGARRRRGRPAVPGKELRPLFPPPGATFRANVEQLAGYFGGDRDTDTTAGRHGGAVESGPGGDDADYLDIEQFARLKRIARKPAPVLFALLLLVSVVACRPLLAGGTLMGGALLPAPGSGLDLWRGYTGDWQAVGTGSTVGAPPYLAVLGAISTLLFGSTQAALTLLLVCSVPLAGLAAYFASRPLVESRLLRAWAAIAYAFLPAVTGALAGGRLGTAVLAVLLPLIARAAVAAFAFGDAEGGKGSWRAVWTYTLLLTLATTFTPVVWPLAAALGAAALVLRRAQWKTYGPRLLATLAVPLLVLAPWSLGLLTHPGRFLHEAGLPYGAGSAGALDLLGLSPGGPKAAGGVLLIGIVLAALAALMRAERQFAVRTAWAAALAALLLAVLVNRTTWAGPATLVYGLALLAAAVLGADGAKERVAASSFGWRQPLAALIALAAAAGPLLGAAGWMLSGAAGPLERRDPVQVPAFVAEESGDRNQNRTLILGGDSPAGVSYTLVRGSGVHLGDAELAAEAGSDSRLDKAVSSLVSGSGADQSSQLGGFAIRYVMIRAGAQEQVRRTLDATPGLTRRHQPDGTALWAVDPPLPRAVILSGKEGQAPIPVASGPVEAHTKIEAGEAGRVLRIADRADSGWQATLDGKPLKPKTVDGWAQGFELPAAGGRLDLVHEDSFTRTAWHWTQGLLALVLLVMALPGRRTRLDDDLPEEEAAIPAQPGPGEPGEGRRARRLRAEAEAAAPAAPTPAEDAAAADPYAEIPAQPVYGDDAYAYQAYGDEGYAYGRQDGSQPQPQPQQEYEQQQYEPYQYPQQGYDQPQQQQPVPDPQHPHPYEPYAPYDTYGQHDPRPDGSPQQ